MNMSKKKSFVLHKDNLSILDKMDDELAGKWIKAVKYYQLEGKPPKGLDPRLDLVFDIIVSQFKRDEEKYDKTCKRNAKNGEKGGRPAKPKKTHSVSTEPKKPDSENENENDSDSGNDKDSDIIVEVDFNSFYTPYIKHSHHELTELMRTKTEKAWLPLTETEKRKAVGTAESFARDVYRKYGSDMRYVKTPHKFLEEKLFNKVKPESPPLIMTKVFDDGVVKWIFKDKDGKRYNENDIYHKKETNTYHKKQ